MRLVSGWQDWPGNVWIHSGTAVQEDDDTDDCCWDQHLSVHTQPGKVQTNFLSKILPVWERETEKEGSPGGIGVWGILKIEYAYLQCSLYDQNR